MSDVMKDGGPAYPQPQVSDGLGSIEYTELEGMSLRDWFAGQALSGLCASIPDERFMDFVNGIQGGMHEARVAYLLADAMLKAREES